MLMVLHETRTLILKFTVNGVPFLSPDVPVLVQILCGAQKASDLLPAGSIYGLDRNKSVELTIPGGAVGGPVSVYAEACLLLMSPLDENRLYNIPFTFTDTPSTCSVALPIPPITSTIPWFGKS